MSLKRNVDFLLFHFQCFVLFYRIVFIFKYFQSDVCAGDAAEIMDKNVAHGYKKPCVMPGKDVYIMPLLHDKCGLFHGSDGNRKYPHTSLKFISDKANLEVTEKDLR